MGVSFGSTRFWRRNTTESIPGREVGSRPFWPCLAFRQLIKRELADSTVIGTANIDFNKQMSIDAPEAASLYNCPVYMPDVDVPQHVSVPLREV